MTKGYIPSSLRTQPKIKGCSIHKDRDFIESPLVILGKIIAADIILNNPDRIPSIWPNSGNASNLHFQVDMTPQVIEQDHLLLDPRNIDKI